MDGTINPPTTEQAQMETSEKTQNVLLSKNTYPVRNELKEVGAKFNGRAWEVTPAQLATLREKAAESARRFNKRDTQFSRDWAAVEKTMTPDD